METKYYQGMLRKQQQILTKVERLMKDPAAQTAFKEVLKNSDYKSDVRPKNASQELTLIWELRQLDEMLEVADQRVVALEAGQISLWERFVAALRSMFSVETNPADRSVEDLRDILTESLVKAEKDTGEPGRRLDYSPTEFCSDPKIVEDERIHSENRSTKIYDFLQKNRKNLSSSSVAHLEHRLNACRKIENLQKNTTYHPPKEGATITRNGQPLAKGESYQEGDKIMLNGVHERRSQNTMNGCWSVSLCSQMEYRGVNLTQEDIRAYRPNNDEVEGSYGTESAPYFAANKKQNIACYYGLAARTMPNAVGHHFACLGATPKDLERIRQIITHALTNCNSPVSICANGHYRTIVGIKGDKIYFKDPLRIVGKPESIDSMTLQEIQKLGNKKDSGIDLTWFSDLKPSLGGSVEPDEQMRKNGVAFIDGQVHLPEISKNINPDSIMFKYEGEIELRRPFDTQSTSAQVQYFYAKDLQYTRLPGGSYNADVLDSMMQTLSAIPNAMDNMEVGGIVEHVQALKNGYYKDDATEGMLMLASRYQNAIRELGDDNQNPELRNTLMKQLADIRNAVVENIRGKYQTKVGDPGSQFVHGNELDSVKNDEKLYNARRAKYNDMKEGMSGVLYLDTLVRDTDLTDTKWIQALQSKNVTTGVQNIQKDPAFVNMINKLYENAAKYEYYVEDVLKARSDVAGKQKEYEKKRKQEEQEKQRSEAAVNNREDRKQETAELMKKATNPSTSKEKTLEQLKAELDAAQKRLDEVEARDPNERKKFFAEIGKDEELHMNPKDAKGWFRPGVLNEKQEILKIKDLRTQILAGVSTDLHGRYLNEKNKLNAAEKKKSDPQKAQEKEVVRESMKKSTVSLNGKG